MPTVGLDSSKVRGEEYPGGGRSGVVGGTSTAVGRVWRKCRSGRTIGGRMRSIQEGKDEEYPGGERSGVVGGNINYG